MRYVHGSTDEIGFHAVEDPHYVTDIHATLLHQLGLQANKLHVPGHKRLDIEFGEVPSYPPEVQVSSRTHTDCPTTNQQPCLIDLRPGYRVCMRIVHGFLYLSCFVVRRLPMNQRYADCLPTFKP